MTQQSNLPASDVRHTVYGLERIFYDAACYAVAEWSRPFSEVEDLKQQLWTWYLESPKTQELLQSVPDYSATNLVKRVSVQKLAKAQPGKDEWDGRNHYNVDNIKDALKGEELNRYLVEILPEAFESLEEQSPQYADALKSRYVDGLIPIRQSKEQVALSRAVKALTEHANRVAISSEYQRDENGKLIVVDGPGSKRVMQKNRPRYKHEEHPELIKSKGEHGDPTANIAIMLMENPELREEFMYEDPITIYTKGKGGA